jgi:hypothetical protein
VQWGAQPGVVGVGQPAQQHQAGANGVHARREPLMRQRLPGRKHRDGLTEYTAQLCGQVIGFPAGGGHHQQRTCTGQCAGDEKPRAGRSDQRQFVRSIGGEVGQALQRWRA